MCAWYPGCVHGYVYLISLVLGINQVFPGAQPKCVVLYIFNTAPTHTLLHNSVDHQLNCPLVCLLCHCVELLLASTLFFSRYTLQFERFKLPRLGSITNQHYHVLPLIGSFHIMFFCVCVYTCTLYSLSYFVLPCIITKSCAKYYYRDKKVMHQSDNTEMYLSVFKYWRWLCGNIKFYARRDRGAGGGSPLQKGV